MNIYHFDKTTGEYLSTSTARLDPVDQDPMIPANATSDSVPTTAANQVAVRNGNAWEVQPDHRGYIGYDAAGVEQQITDLNVVPDPAWTLTPPFIIADARAIKIDEINALVAGVITGGFVSDGLGSDHTYQSQQEDQINLSGLAGSGATWPFKCSADAGVTWAYLNHTNTQFGVVVNHGITHKLGALQTGEILKAQVAAAADQAALDAIVWP